MKEALYSWIKCLAVFYILLTMLLYLVPTEKYQRYVRFFMGMVLIVMLTAPVFSIIEKSRELPGSFSRIYSQEENKRILQDMENLQKSMLEGGMEKELGKNILENLNKKGLEIIKCEVQIEGDVLKAAIWTKALDENSGRVIKSELQTGWGIREENCEIYFCENGEQTVGTSPSSGPASYSDRASGNG